MSDNKYSVLVFITGISLGIIAMGILVQCSGNNKSEAKAVDSCGAYYHPQTGKFTWKECPKQEPTK